VPRARCSETAAKTHQTRRRHTMLPGTHSPGHALQVQCGSRLAAQTSFCDSLHQRTTSKVSRDVHSSPVSGMKGGGDRVVGLRAFQNGSSGCVPTIGYTSPADGS
jgi:hypothetical protein